MMHPTSADSALFRGRPLRVLHAAYSIAGQSLLLAQGLRANGCDSTALSYRVDWDGRGGDQVVELDHLDPVRRGAAMLATFLGAAVHYDVFHLHFGTSILPRLLDVPLLERAGKRIVFHFHGCDVRNRSHMLSRHLYSTCTECDPFCRPGRQNEVLAMARRYAHLMFYSTLDLAESVPGGEHLPLAVDAARWRAAADAHPLPEPERRDGVRGPVVIGHAPTNRLIKGTRFVIEAVERLRHEFPRLELRMMERRPWGQVPEFFGGCDLVVDQLFMGWYSLAAVEAMAMGRPVVTRLRHDFEGHGPWPPIASADPVTLAGVLRELIADPARRAEMGARSLEFVREHHDVARVGRRLLECYRGVLGPDGRGGGTAAAVER